MPNDLQTARYDGLIRRVGGLLGGGSKVTETLSELFPMIDVENVPSELLFLGGWRTGISTQTVAATVGETSRAQIQNPVGSGKLVVVTDVYLTTQQTAVAYTTTETLFAPAFAGFLRDSRTGADGRTSARVAEASTGNTGLRGTFTTVANRTFHHFAQGNDLFVLAPGTALEYGSVTDNVAVDITFFWRERAALSSELNFP